jgi:hypothetical protein
MYQKIARKDALHFIIPPELTEGLREVPYLRRVSQYDLRKKIAPR